MSTKTKIVFKDSQTCQLNQKKYHNPSNKNLTGAFPFAISIQQANKEILSHVLSDSNRKEDYKDVDLTINTGLQEIIDQKLNSNVYELICSKHVINTFDYLFHKIGEGIYIQIKKNKIKKFMPFINREFINNWNLKYDPKYFQDKGKNIKLNLKKIQANPDLWQAQNCIIRNQIHSDINSSYWAEIYDMIDETCKKREVADTEIFINRRTFPVLKTDYSEPYNHLYDSDTHPLTSYAFHSYHPICGFNTTDRFADLPIPSADDWKMITQGYFLNECQNEFILPHQAEKRQKAPDASELDSELVDLEKNPIWEEKIPTCFFRGSSYGCGITPETNIRLKVAELSVEWEKSPSSADYLDAGITHFSQRDQKLEGHDGLSYQNPDDYKFKQVDFVPLTLSGRYKYVLNINGFGFSHQLAYHLSLGVMVMIVKDDRQTWYSHLLKPFKHYVPIKPDLSNLKDAIKWARTHDDEAKQIARNGKRFFMKYFKKDVVYDYLAYVFNSVAIRRVDLLDISKRFQKYQSKLPILQPKKLNLKIDKNPLTSNRVAIIVPYRNSPYHDYKQIKHKFLKNMTSMLSKYCQHVYGKSDMFKIFIIEQSEDQRKFNRGQLFNLGASIANQEGFTHLVFHSIRAKPSNELIPYYFSFDSMNQAPISIYFDWFEFQQRIYFNQITGFSVSMFKKLGYPNQFWGLRGDSDALYAKYCSLVGRKGFFWIPNTSVSGKVEFYEETFSPKDYPPIIADPQTVQLKILQDAEYTKSNLARDFNIVNYQINKYWTVIHRKRSVKKSRTNNKKKSITRSNQNSTKEIRLIDQGRKEKYIQHYVFNLIQPDKSSLKLLFFKAK